MKKLTKKITKLLVSIILCIPFTAQASVISVGDSIFGNDSVTLDTGSGLEWLDVTLSLGRSYNDVSTEFGMDGDFEGFRYATGLEFETLFINITGGSDYSIFTRQYYSEGSNNIDEGILMLGDTYAEYFFGQNGFTSDEAFGGTEGSGIGTHLVKGLLSDQHESQIGYIYGAGAIDLEESNSGDDFSTRKFQAIGRNEIRETYGSFLVRAAPIPEPSTMLLLLAGLLGWFYLVKFAREKSYNKAN